VSKRIGFLYDSFTSWSNLYLAYQKAVRHKKSKSETAEWMYHCEKNLFDLQSELKEERYLPRPYKYFMISEPKERVISVAAFRDRVVHHALVNILEPYYELSFIHDSYATRKDKGLHRAVIAAQKYSRTYSWYLKLDIEKFFASINHEILFSLISHKIKDPKIMSICRVILKNQTLSMGLEENVGLPVGNLTSQFFANIYLNKLDHYIKQDLGYHAYVRYMDDFILYSNNVQDLKKSLKQIAEFLKQQLGLRIKPKSIQLNRISLGIPFLGYRIFPRMIRVRKENLKRCLQGIKKTEIEYKNGMVTSERLYHSTRSRMGFIGFANSNNLQKSIWGRNQKAVTTG
jgi:RNA-directed DNA polymerase